LKNWVVRIFCGAFAFTAASAIWAQDSYIDIAADLQSGASLEEVANRAYENSPEYWKSASRNGQQTAADQSALTDGDDEELSAGEAVTAIYSHAQSLAKSASPDAQDIVKVTVSVIDAWPDCQDTFDAVRSAVELEPARADEIVATVANKRNCNCSNGGLWLDQRVQERIRVELRFATLDAPFECSCSQVAMYAGVAGLPENRQWNDNLPEARKAELIASMTERVTLITERTAAMQSHNGWDCSCTDINIAASMQGIAFEGLRNGTYESLGNHYAYEAGDSGLVVDSFGMVGTHPASFWGDASHSTANNVLRRKDVIFRGDSLILDPFDPATEFTSEGDRRFEKLGQHQVIAENQPTDVFISTYAEGWNQESLQQPESARDPNQRNRIVELYNGSNKTIDLGESQYFLEIYEAQPGASASQAVATPPVLAKRTISLQSDVTFDFDKSAIRPEASADLRQVVSVLNEADIFSEILIVGHTCDMGSDEYNLELSKRRADSVMSYLQQAGLKDVPVRTEGRGEEEPRLPNTSEENRSMNRRVDIVFVAAEGKDVQTIVDQSDPLARRRYEFTFMAPIPPTVQSVDSQPASSMLAGGYYQGDMNPRQVIGLNGAIEPGKTFVVAYSESDEAIRDIASEVTNLLDFKPNETLVLRRLGGEMALYCRASAYSYTANYPAQPLIRYPQAETALPNRNDGVASPN